MNEIYDQRILSHSRKQPEERIFSSIWDFKLPFSSSVKEVPQENSCEQYSKPGKYRKVVQGSEVFGSEPQPEKAGKTKIYILEVKPRKAKKQAEKKIFFSIF